jgi:uracil-DNA glycosylase
MHPPVSEDPRAEALREVMRLAAEDRRRGIRYWFDSGLTDDLRALVLGMGEGAPSRPAPPIPRPDMRGSAAASVPPAAPAPRAPAPVAPAQVASAPAAPAAAAPAPVPAAPASAAPAAARAAWPPPPPAEGREPDWPARLQAVEQEALACTRCGLCETRHTVVFGTGGARTPLVFVGEAPGADEDAQGIPFVGRAGQLLTKIIAAIGLSREDVYICNVLKCRPPGNRNPAPDEIAHCWSYLERQLDLLRPKVICTLGLFATQTLLHSTLPIGKLRGRIFEEGGRRIVPTYHPAALLRNPGWKATVWEDVQLLRKVLDS